MKLERSDEASTLSLIRENRRLRELVVSLSATLLRTISREAAVSVRIEGSDDKADLRRAAVREVQKALRFGAERVPLES
jgi:hypothetical protein